MKTELAEHRLREVHRILDLLNDLLRGAEDVRIVLREAAHAEKSVAHAVLLVAVDGSEFRQTHRQIAVGTLLELIDLDVERAVHGLYVVFLDIRVVARTFLHLHAGEHAFLVKTEMPRSLPEIGAADVRGVNNFVSRLVMALAPVFLDGDADARTLGEPVREPGAYRFGDGEKLKLLAENAVVAAARLLFAGENFIKLRLIFRDDAVDSLKHLVLLVAAVVAAGDAGELDDSDLGRARHVRTAAHFDVIADRIGGDRLAFGNVGKALKLVFLTGKHLLALFAGNLFAHKRLIERDQTGDFGFYFGKIVG